MKIINLSRLYGTKKEEEKACFWSFESSESKLAILSIL
jgi:hypothetical protein